MVGVEAGVQLGEPLPVGLDRAGHPHRRGDPTAGLRGRGRAARAPVAGPQGHHDRAATPPGASFSWCSTWRAVGVEAGVQLGEPLPVGLDRAGHPDGTRARARSGLQKLNWEHSGAVVWSLTNTTRKSHHPGGAAEHPGG
jgi:hypothetical protein